MTYTTLNLRRRTVESIFQCISGQSTFIYKKNTFLLKKAKRRLREIDLITHLKYKQHNCIYKQETDSGCSSTHQGHSVARCKCSADRTTTRISIFFLFLGLVYYNGYFVSMWVSCQHRPASCQQMRHQNSGYRVSKNTVIMGYS